jgi:hypothetical protein
VDALADEVWVPAVGEIGDGAARFDGGAAISAQ